MSSMQAIQVNGGTLSLTSLPIPNVAEPYDLLVRIRAVALNPVDTKVLSRAKDGRILGYDAAGTVEAVGPQAESLGFSKGDAVLYAGAIGRPGSNAQFQLVDARLVGRKPESLNWDEAAALPLVGLTAWEMFEDHFGLKPFTENPDHTLLVVNGAGGVGTMALALASKVFGIKTIVATASRPETIEWVKKFGATHVINHRQHLGPQLQSLNITPSLAFITYDTPRYTKELIPLMRPFGHIGSIVETNDVVPIHDDAAFARALTFHWEMMFTKANFGFNLETQGRIVTEIARLSADGTLPSAVTVRKEFSLDSLKEMHALQSSGKAYGKIAFVMPETLQ